MRRRTAAAGVAVLAALAGCSSAGSSGPATLPAVTATPDLQGLLSQPVAQPRHCPPHTNGETTGRQSPWLGSVDLSVFAGRRDSPARLRAIGTYLRKQPLVRRLYFESQREAYREFQRLYTCSARLTPDRLPASWRVVLAPGTTVDERDALVARAQLLPGVQVVACDPSLPCVDVVRSVDPALTAPARSSRSAR